MNALAPLHRAFAERGLLPPDGSCTCMQCGRAGLDRSAMADPGTLSIPVCIDCVKQLLSGYVICGECGGSSGGVRIDDILRGPRTEWCARCDGDGKVYVGVPKRLRGKTFNFLEDGGKS